MKPVLLGLFLIGGCSGTSGSVLATDGAMDLAPAADLTSATDLHGLGPAAMIVHPADGQMNHAGAAVSFVGHATDPTDGALTGGSLVWTSSLVAGPIGTGETFSASFNAGTHLITLTATDSKGLTDSVSVTLIIN